MGTETEELIMEELKEIKEALLGDYDKKGVISRVRWLEKVLTIQWSIVIIAIGKVITDVIM